MMYLDNALAPHEVMALQEELSADPQLQAVLADEQKFRALLKARLHRQPATDALVQGIQARLDQEVVGASATEA